MTGKSNTRTAPVWLTIEQLAERQQVAPDTVRYWRKRGEGPPGALLGGAVRYRLSDVEAWENERAEAAKAEHEARRRAATP